MSNRILSVLKEGLITKNPTFFQLLGMCPTLAVTTTVFNSVGMGLATTAVLCCSNVMISLLRKLIPNEVRIASFIVIISGFVTAVDLIMKAYFVSLSKTLGLFIPLIVVNCIILGRAEAFCYKNTVAASAVDGICQGLGYTIVLIIMCVIREFLGSGTFGGGILNGGDGIQIFSSHFGALGISLPVGGFLVLACVIAAMQYFLNRPKKAAKSEEVAQ